jgi:hypothetical protein
MTRTVNTDTTDQSIRFWAYDSDGAAVTGEAYNSDGMAVSVVVRRKGRIESTTSLTLVARSGSGIHTDSALTEAGSGEYVVDLPDSYFATDGDHVSLTVASTAITGTVVVESLGVVTDKLTTERLAKIDGAMQTGADGDTGETLSDQIDGIGGGPSAEDIRIEMDSNSTQLATIAADLVTVKTTANTPKQVW